jgi:hypothetical protein
MGGWGGSAEGGYIFKILYYIDEILKYKEIHNKIKRIIRQEYVNTSLDVITLSG